MLNRVDPVKSKTVNETLKEAVSEALLTNLYQSISGAGAEGRIVVAHRPSSKFVSGFLESIAIARNFGMSVDESANPIHIITMGMDLQMGKGIGSIIHIAPSFSLYVRMLPTTTDLTQHKTHLGLSNDTKRLVRQQTREAILGYDQKNADLKKDDPTTYYRNRRELRQSLIDNILQHQLGVQLSSDAKLKTTSDPENEEQELEAKFLKEGEAANNAEEEPEESTEETPGNAQNGDISFHVFPGMTSVIPSNIVSPVRPLQRWLRIDFRDMLEISVNVDTSDADLEAQLANASNEMNQLIQQRLRAWIADSDPETGGKLWAYPTGLTVTAEEIQHWDETLVTLRKRFHSQNDPTLFALPQLELKWSVELIDSHDDASICSVQIAIENQTDTTDWNSVEVEEAIFQAKLNAHLDANQHRPIKLDRIKPSYQYLKYLNHPALGYNNGVTASKDGGELLLKTTWMPVYRQPRIRPLEYADIDVRFDTLQTLAGTRALTSISDQFRRWINDTKTTINPTDGCTTSEQAVQEQDRFDRDCKSWQRESDKIQLGAELLSKSADAFEKNQNCREATPYKAWVYMNEAMGLAAKPKNFDRWRLFQIAFVLANIPGLVSRMNEFSDVYDGDWDEAVALLYFATGGGKTESFFGLLVYNLFLDRLRGKLNGVTALIRYPLRLLTIQQAQRLAKTLAKAEEVRWRYKIPGREFAIGFWVGGSNTPNKRSAITLVQVPTFRSSDNPSEAALQNSSDYQQAMESWNKLPSCPFCGGKTSLRRYSSHNGLIGHACTSPVSKCIWNARHGGIMHEPLPFYIVDEDLYELAPSVVLGTIDKLALIGQHPSTIRRFLGMFGLAPLLDDSNQHLIPLKSPQDLRDRPEQKLFPIYEKGAHYFYDPFPSLIIQDEAHLLEESLGTFSGIFETTFERMLHMLGDHPRMRTIVAKAPNSNTPRMPKIVAASATVTEPERQMEGLYQRKVAQFPHPGPRLYYSFYATPLASTSVMRQAFDDIEISAHTARFYASILSNGRPHTGVSVEILGHFHLLITQLLQQLNSDDPADPGHARDRIKNGIQNSVLAELYAPSIDDATDEALATLIDLHRISLTYVTNKKGGDQIMAAENDATGRIHEDAGINQFDGLHAKLISGGVSAGEIEEVIKMAERRPAPGQPFEDILDNDLLRSVVATSAISHGVDVDEFNTMFFAGMPSSPSEYIQSSSRVGRTHVGISILIPTPQRRRDRYILETHDQYHRFLERMIRPAAVNRWAENAMIRTLPSLLQAYLVGVCENLALMDADDSHKHHVRNHERLEQIVQIINESTNIMFRDNVCDFVNDSIGLNHPDYSPSAANEFRVILREQIREIIEFLIINQELLGLTALFNEMNRVDTRQKKEPMTSLRDVDPAGQIQYVRRHGSAANSETVYEIMKIIRKGRS